MVPDFVRMKYQEWGGIIRMTEVDIYQEAFLDKGYRLDTAGTVAGAFDYNDKTLYVNDENPAAVIHEMGHFINDFLGMYSQKAENKAIFESEAGKVSAYAKSNTNEYFAECFKLYTICPVYLQSVSPDSFLLVANALNQMAVQEYN